MMRLNLIVIAIGLLIPGIYAQNFIKLGQGFEPRTFYHQQNINYYINCADELGNVYSVHYDTVSSSFNYGQEFSKIRLRIYNGFTWLNTTPIEIYSKNTIDAPRIMDIKYWEGKIYISGSFDSSENNLGAGLLVYDGSWKSAGLNLQQRFPDYFEVNAIHTFKDGLLVTGNFDSIPGMRVNGMMMYYQGVWNAVGQTGACGFKGLSGTSNVFFYGGDSLYVFNKNKIKPDSIEIGNTNFKKLGVWRNGQFEPIPYPSPYIAAVSQHNGKLVIIPSSNLVYISKISMLTGNQWTDYNLPDNDSFYATNFIGTFTEDNVLYLLFQSPGDGIVVYKLEGTIIKKYSQFKLSDTYINIEFRTDENSIYLAGNFQWVNQGMHQDSVRRILKLNFKPKSLLTGICFNDLNGDKIKQPGEALLQGVRVYDALNRRMTLTDGKGHFTMTYSTGSEWQISADNLKGIKGTSTFQMVNSVDSVYYYEFPLQTINTDDIGVYVYSQSGLKAKQGFKTRYIIELSNLSSVNRNIQLKFKLDKRVTEKYFEGFNPDINVAGYWIKNIDIKANSNQYYQFECIYSVDSFNLDELVEVKAEINSNDNNSRNNEDVLKQTIVSAYDPNMKVASPSAVISNNDVIKYVIYFENLGNSEAINVTVVDSIGSLLDIYSIVWGGTSHDSKLKFRVENNSLIWSFEGIDLPARKQDSIKCNGYVTLRVNLMSSAKEGDTIYNKAAIFFDYQKAVITNKATVVFDRNKTINSITEANGLMIYPNPGNGLFQYRNETNLMDWKICDLSGKTILELTLSETGTIQLEEVLSAGCYLLQSSDGTMTMKLIILN